MQNWSIMETSHVRKPEIRLRKTVNSYVSPRVGDVIREHVRQKVHENIRYQNPDHDALKAFTMQIPDKAIRNELEDFKAFPTHPSFQPKAETMIPTTFGTAGRFIPDRIHYTKHAMKLSLLDWENQRRNKRKIERVLNFELQTKRKDNFLTKE